MATAAPWQRAGGGGRSGGGRRQPAAGGWRGRSRPLLRPVVAGPQPRGRRRSKEAEGGSAGPPMAGWGRAAGGPVWREGGPGLLGENGISLRERVSAALER